MYHKNKRKGFTLAEVLITLVVIGVIAAITVPVLINKYQEEQTITKLNSSYSILSQALKMAEIKNGKIDTWDIGPGDSAQGAQKLYNYIAPEIKKLKSCGTTSDCFADNYKTLKGNNATQPKTTSSYAKGIMNNGVSFFVWSIGSGCNRNVSITNSGSLTRQCGSIIVDINGNKKPNRAGYDYFGFIITKDGLIPSGTKDTVISTVNSICNVTSNAAQAGLDCTAWVLYKKNFDYKHQIISWD